MKRCKAPNNECVEPKITDCNNCRWYRVSNNSTVINPNEVNTNFMQVIPNSQFFTNLEQIKTCVSINIYDNDYLLRALENTIKEFGNVKFEYETSKVCGKCN